MRVFIALDLPQSAVEMLCAVQDKLLDSGVGGRPVAPENLHITLRFLGDINKKTADKICSLVAETLADIPAPILSLSGISAFVRSNGDLVYAQVSGDINAVHDIERKITRALQTIGIQPESRPFMPHITLIRRARFGARQVSAHSEQFYAGSVVVYDSDLSQTPPVYTKLYEHPLPR